MPSLMEQKIIKNRIMNNDYQIYNKYFDTYKKITIVRI